MLHLCKFYVLVLLKPLASDQWSPFLPANEKKASKSKYSQKLENGTTGIPRMLCESRHLHQVSWSELEPGNHGEKREPTAKSCFLISINIFSSWFSW